MYALYQKVCAKCSEMITKEYSTSFTLGIRVFDRRFRSPIYAIYGFVRLADEIVDTFHGFDKATLLDRFKRDTHQAIAERISLNPVLHAFQDTVWKYNIDLELIDAFLHSMEMDLTDIEYDSALYNKYIYGSAEVVGLMTLKVFCEGDRELYESLREPARSLGAAFQKINFLRDLRADYYDRGRIYFPGVDFNKFTDEDKRRIEGDIRQDFDNALDGIMRLPIGARFGVYLAYTYFFNLYKKISRVKASKVAEKRIRISDKRKIYLLVTTAVKLRMGLI